MGRDSRPPDSGGGAGIAKALRTESAYQSPQQNEPNKMSIPAHELGYSFCWRVMHGSSTRIGMQRFLAHISCKNYET